MAKNPLASDFKATMWTMQISMEPIHSLSVKYSLCTVPCDRGFNLTFFLLLLVGLRFELVDIKMDKVRQIEAKCAHPLGISKASQIP